MDERGTTQGGAQGAATLKEDIQEIYDMADSGMSLAGLMEGIGGVLSRHPAELVGIIASYRLHASDTGYTTSFALRQGVFEVLDSDAPVDVAITGKEADLLLVMQRKLSPVMALLRGKIKLNGSKGALLALGEFL